ncbi:unnamed protein product [Hymenolepis diminuta]|uniref:Uncharacterized protein n=1 Tax=Hymenolepis diminuta TaxID=6216 RepID=A0A564Y7U4_HYMDI|nr:unnamed protein product [Hymenolepis diminuta]
MLNILYQYAEETNDKQLRTQCLKAGANPNFIFPHLSPWDQQNYKIVLNYLRHNGLNVLAATYSTSNK